MGDVQPVLPSRHDADLRALFAANTLVQIVRPDVRESCVHLVIEHVVFQLMRRRHRLQPRRIRHVEIRRDDFYAVRAAIDDRRAFNRIFQAFQTDPKRSKAR